MNGEYHSEQSCLKASVGGEDCHTIVLQGITMGVIFSTILNITLCYHFIINLYHDLSVICIYVSNQIVRHRMLSSDQQVFGVKIDVLVEYFRGLLEISSLEVVGFGGQ